MAKDKVICKCYKITKQDMVELIEDGVTSYKDVRKKTKIGKKCSSCKSKNKTRFKKYKKKYGA
jgi:NAD(P)H-nitrite reductase large subunit